MLLDDWQNREVAEKKIKMNFTFLPPIYLESSFRGCFDPIFTRTSHNTLGWKV